MKPRNEGTKERRNEGTKERRNEGTKERRNEGTKEGTCVNEEAVQPASVGVTIEFAQPLWLSTFGRAA